MTIRKDGLTRRQYIAATGAALAAGLGGATLARAQAATIRQGYQTNMWGMPTYYLLRSGLLEKRGLKVEEFAVPSGNLTMQQMVARQVDLGTYAGPSLILGHDKGGMAGIAVVEYVRRTCALVVPEMRCQHSERRDQNAPGLAPDALVGGPSAGAGPTRASPVHNVRFAIALRTYPGSLEQAAHSPGADTSGWKSLARANASAEAFHVTMRNEVNGVQAKSALRRAWWCLCCDSSIRSA